MPAVFWIHCNACNALLKKENQQFLLSCKHISCKKCLNETGGKKCPTCKNDIQFKELSTLPNNLKGLFEPNIEKLLQTPNEVLQFQQNHMQNMIRNTQGYKMKCRKMMQMYQKEKAEVMKAKGELQRFIAQRKAMQQKLKEIYVKNQQTETYRDPKSMSGFSSEHSKTISSRGSSGFFDETISMKKSKSLFSGFFDADQNDANESSQFDHAPFFS